MITAMSKYRPVLMGIAALLFVSCSQTDDSRITGTGTIEAIEVRVSAKVGGNVSDLRVSEGTAVAEGDTIAVLDYATYAVQLRQAMAGVELAEAQLDLMLKGARDEDIRTAEEGVRQAEAALSIAREDYRRMSNLFDASSISRKQLDDAEARFTVASAQFNASRENLQKLLQFSRPEEIRAQRARLSQATATADLFEKNIHDSYIVAPVSGVVTQKAIERGELARPGSPVVVISKLDTVRLTIYLKTSDVGRIRLGQEVDITIDAFPDRVFGGTITYISPSAEFTPRNIQTKDERVKQVFGVRVEIPNPEGVLKPGLPADATMEIP
jgi:HlyD family secretion protein